MCKICFRTLRIWRYTLNKRACEETNDAKRCSASHLLSSCPEIISTLSGAFGAFGAVSVTLTSHHKQWSCLTHCLMIFLFVPLGSGCTECSNACEITSFPYTCRRRAVQEQPRTPACSNHAYWSRCRSTRWCSRRRLHDLLPSGSSQRTGGNRQAFLYMDCLLRRLQGCEDRKLPRQSRTTLGFTTSRTQDTKQTYIH